MKKKRDKRRRQNDHYKPDGPLLKSLKEELGYKDEIIVNEGSSYVYKKHTTKIAKSMKQHQAAVLDLYELLRKKGLHKEAAMLLDAYKKNLVTFKKTYDMIMRKLI